MILLKKIFVKLFIFEIIYLLVATISLTCGLYFNVLSQDTFNIIIEVFFFLNAFLLSFYSGLKIGRRGLLIGFIAFLFFSIILITVNLATKLPFNLKFYIKLALTLTTLLFGSILGVNISRKN